MIIENNCLVQSNHKTVIAGVCTMFQWHLFPNAVCSLVNKRCYSFPCSDWATTPILENIPDSLGDIERVKTH